MTDPAERDQWGQWGQWGQRTIGDIARDVREFTARATAIRVETEAAVEKLRAALERAQAILAALAPLADREPGETGEEVPSHDDRQVP